MANPAVYLVTRARLNNLDRVVPKWNEGGGPVRLVVEPKEVRMVTKRARERGWEIDTVVSPPRPNRGIGRARNAAVMDAYVAGEREIIMADDDLYLRDTASHARRLTNAVRGFNIVGCGAWCSFYGLSLGNRPPPVPKPVSGSMGYRLFALNIDLMMRRGINFDPRLDMCYEDGELCRRSLTIGKAWHVHCGVPTVSLHGRYQPGGLSDFAHSNGRRMRREKACHVYVFERWGERYISHPNKTFRCNWKRLHQDNNVKGVY